jgi:hypothetical protein
LRDRAAKRAADAIEAAAATPPPSLPAMSEIEALAISDMPLEAPAPEVPAVEAPATEIPAPVEAAPVVEPSVEAAPVVEAPVVEAPVIEAPVVEASVVEVPVAETPVVETPAVEAPIPVIARPRPTAAPSFLRVRTASAGGALTARWQRIATIGGLSVLLALQLLLAQRDVLAADARWRPTVGALCALLRCSVPDWRQPDAFVMLSRDVRPHARAPGTLQIDASFRNDARWPQPWPRLVVSLSDIDGRVVGTRAFSAREYLGAQPTQNTLASGQTAAVHLAVIEPAPGIVAFSFEFR